MNQLANLVNFLLQILHLILTCIVPTSLLLIEILLTLNQDGLHERLSLPRLVFELGEELFVVILELHKEVTRQLIKVEISLVMLIHMNRPPKLFTILNHLDEVDLQLLDLKPYILSTRAHPGKVVDSLVDLGVELLAFLVDVVKAISLEL